MPWPNVQITTLWHHFANHSKIWGLGVTIRWWSPTWQNDHKYQTLASWKTSKLHLQHSTPYELIWNNIPGNETKSDKELLGDLYDIYYNNRDMRLMLELFAISSGVAPAICFFTIFDKVVMGQMKCLVEYLCTSAEVQRRSDPSHNSRGQERKRSACG